MSAKGRTGTPLSSDLWNRMNQFAYPSVQGLAQFAFLLSRFHKNTQIMFDYSLTHKTLGFDRSESIGGVHIRSWLDQFLTGDPVHGPPLFVHATGSQIFE